MLENSGKTKGSYAVAHVPLAGGLCGESVGCGVRLCPAHPCQYQWCHSGEFSGAPGAPFVSPAWPGRCCICPWEAVMLTKGGERARHVSVLGTGSYGHVAKLL